MNAGDDRDISAAARQLLEDDMQSRLAVVDELAEAQGEEDELVTRLEEVQQRHASLYADAERRGWTAQQLKKLGLRPPQRRAPGRPRGKSAGPKKPRPATAVNDVRPAENEGEPSVAAVEEPASAPGFPTY